jgi:hypothetical protein
MILGERHGEGNLGGGRLGRKEQINAS